VKRVNEVCDIVAIGASAGGFEALCTVLSRLPDDFEIPIGVVQHRARDSEALASLLQDCTRLRVVDVEDKEPVTPGAIYIAPPDYHMLVEDGVFALSTEAPVGYSRPSIDVFFESVADVYGPGAIGVVLTGANADGARGLQQIVLRGGQALIQDPSTAEMPVMPASAQELVKRARIMTLAEIAAHLTEHNHRRVDRSGDS
jgi:two-component system, chemotaxis family, protein-glutamate methylesterase/glutaminase